MARNSLEHELAQVILSAFPLEAEARMPEQTPLEWDALATFARDQGMAPLLFAALQKTGCWERVPGPAAEILRAGHMRSGLFNLLVFRELDHVQKLLQADAIPLIPLKGAALAGTLYPDMSLRPMGDLDILVPFANAPRVCDLLMQNGYRPLLEPRADFRWDLVDTRALTRGGKYPMMIEVHTHLWHLPYFRERIPIDWFWRHTMPVEINGRPMFILSPIAQFLHLAAHFTLHHHNHGMLWSYDLALLLARYGHQIDWSALSAAAHEFGITEVVRGALAQVSELWKVSLPQEASALMNRPVGLRERILFAAMTVQQGEAREVWDWTNVPGPRAKAAYVLATLFPSPEYMRKRYQLADSRSLPVHYARRLGRGAVQFIRSGSAMVCNAIKVFAHRPAGSPP